MQEMPDHIKRKLLMFFLETSVPRIIAEKRRKRKNDKDNLK